jgi:hypothetical protein
MGIDIMKTLRPKPMTFRGVSRCRRSFIWFSVTFGIMLALFGQNAAASSSRTNDWAVDVFSQYFYWHESGPGFTIKESGPEFGVDLTFKNHADKGWLGTGRLKFYYGAVDYRATSTISTTTHYVGGLAELGGGYRWKTSHDRSIDLVGGVGAEDWDRSFQGYSGYGANWLPIYLKGGLETGPDENGWTGALGIKLPVYVIEQTDFSFAGYGTITLHPAVRPSGYASAGYQFNRHFSVTTFFDSYWFGQSPFVNSGGASFYQPESFTFQVGLKLSWAF